ncbi:MAG TPA: hypothetical protein VG848_06555 [Acetobacteraceae bacterium]|jgi:flagellar biosynthesis/type III secretory pathway protein FliH|nr:hypothetical protein [Acetobacteraceae bacterium]
MRRFRPVIPQAPSASVRDVGILDEETARKDEEAKRKSLLNAELERAKEEGRGSGYREGWEAAAADVRARLDPPLADLAGALRSRLAEIDALLAGVTPDIARLIVHHAIELAEALVSAPCAFDRTQLARRLIAEAAAENGPPRKLVCLAHPETIALLEEDLRRAGCAGEPHPEMTRGGIVLRLTDIDLGREISEWDASVARQVGQLRKLLSEGETVLGE